MLLPETLVMLYMKVVGRTRDEVCFHQTMFIKKFETIQFLVSFSRLETSDDHLILAVPRTLLFSCLDKQKAVRVLGPPQTTEIVFDD